MALFKRGKWWHIDIIINGKRIRQSLHTNNKFRARELYGQKKRELQEEANEHKVKFSDFKKQYLDWAKGTKKSADREEQRLQRISNYFSDLGIIYLSDISPYHVEQMKTWLVEQKLSKATVNRYLQLLRGFFYRAIDWGVFSGQNPVKKVKLFREDANIRPLTKFDVERIIQAAKEIRLYPASPIQKIFADLIILAINTGMRKAEILNLRWHDIKDNSVMIKGKGGKIREIPLNQIALAVITKQEKKGEFVFDVPNRGQGDLMRRTVSKIRELSGISWHFHLLRHFFASNLIEHGVNLFTVSAILGHSSRMTSLLYTHVDKGQMKKAVDSLIS